VSGRREKDVHVQSSTTALVTLGRKESEGASLSPFMDTKDWVAKLTTNSFTQ